VNSVPANRAPTLIEIDVWWLWIRDLSADKSPFLFASDNRCRLCHLPDIMIPVRLPNHWPFGDRAFRFLVGGTGVQENDLTAVQY
jgi:hypothetical protein